MKTRLCINEDCHRQFNGASGHRKCPRCRARAAQKLCACGAKIWAGSAQCVKCLGLAQRGKNNPNFKAGRYIKDGYVMVSAPDHPRHEGKKGNYVFEHILVMEKFLGRYLAPSENVHHKNGVRDDNRIENLELWVVTQPSGQRAEDLLAWAKEILNLYEPMKAERENDRAAL